MGNTGNLLAIYTPKELAAMTLRDIKDRRYKKQREQKEKDNQAKSVLIETAYRTTKRQHLRRI